MLSFLPPVCLRAWSQAVAAEVLAQATPIIAENKPKFIDAIEFESLTLGLLPPAVIGEWQVGSSEWPSQLITDVYASDFSPGQSVRMRAIGRPLLLIVSACWLLPLVGEQPSQGGSFNCVTTRAVKQGFLSCESTTLC